WVGTGDGLNRLDRESGSIIQYFHDPQDDGSLSNDTITSIIQDHTGVLWIGTQGGLNRLYHPKGKFSRIQFDPEDPRGLSSNLISALYEDQDGYLWVGTAGAGLDRRDPANGRFDHFSYAEDERPPETLGLNHILSFYEDVADSSGDAQEATTSGDLWIGTMGGLIRFDREQEEVSYYRHNSQDNHSLIHNQVNDIHRDRSGVLWLATGAGLDRYDPDTDSFRHFSGEGALANNMILAILEDDSGRLWISHNSGLTRYDPQLGVVRNYDTADGLQSLEFNRGARFQNQQGEMFFGGVNGFNLFDPAEIHDNPYLPPLVVTDLQILNQSVPIGPQSVLQKPIYRTEAIKLSGQEPVLTFELAALHYGAPEEVQYAYLMQGFDRAWNYLGNRRYATYTNLPPGDYVFRAIGSNSDGVWNEQGVAIAVAIPRPFWQSLWFIGLSLLVALAAIFTGYRLRSRSLAARTRELEEQVARRTAEIEKRQQIAEGLREILVLLNTKRSLAESLHYIVSQAARLTDAEDAIIFRLDEGREMTIVATNPGGQIRYEPDAELLGIIEEWPSEDASERGPLIVPSLDRFWLDNPAIHSWDMSTHRALLGIPLQFDDDSHGGLFMFYTEERDFSADDLDLGRTFGDQATLAIANDSLRRQAEQTAIASERSRLARELHDAVTQTIFSASLLTETLEPIWEMDRDEGRKLLAELRQLTRGALAEMRTLLLELRPSALEDSSLSSLLSQLAEAVTGRTGVPVSAQMEKTRELPVNVRIALYRIAQESLNNVVKHARATRVSLTLRASNDGDGVILTVKDNGRGFEEARVSTGRLGLGIISERAAAIDAQLSITSAPGQGTTVKVVWVGKAVV
ncbi:MAG: two-component regulator propeller domain-containing protein, partial [Chloroflexota bacterium]